MPRFAYRAVDGNGRAFNGVQEADSAQACVAQLTEQGLRVNGLDPLEPRRTGLFHRKAPLTWEDLDLLNEQLAALAKGGLPLPGALEALARDVQRKRLRDVLRELSARLETGASLSEALDARPETFSPVYRGIVRAGERTGNLSVVLDHLCAYSSRMVELKHGIQEAMAYPCIVVLAACAIVGFLLYQVVPVFVDFYGEFEGTLPLPTRCLAFLSTLVRYHGPGVLAGAGGVVAVGAFFVWFMRRDPALRAATDRLMLSVPVFGHRYRAAAQARFSRALGLLLESGTPVLESLQLAAEAADNAPLHRAVERAARRVENGETIAAALQDSGFFGPTYCWLLGNAERAGEIPAALLNRADDLEADVERRDRLIVSMSGPLLLFALGILVGLIVLSLYLPIYSIGERITG